MFLALSLLLAYMVAMVSANMPNYVVVTRQTSDNIGYVESMDGETGRVMFSANISFQFQWPYVQMNTNYANNRVYVLTIPEDSIPRLYELQSTANALTELGLWTIEDGTIIFDLQSSESKNTLFGIKVTGKYQRTLSNIALEANNKMKITELYDLPEYWYVNASSYDGKKDTYFALINNFPGREESTLEQQLLMVNFTDVQVGEASSPPALLVPIVDEVYHGQLQFIAWYGRFLFAAGINLQTNVAYITLIDQATGKTSDLDFMVENVTEVGPLVTHSNHGTTGYLMNLFVKHGDENWTLYAVEYNSNAEKINVVWHLRDYAGSDYNYFAAATRAFDEY